MKGLGPFHLASFVVAIILADSLDARAVAPEDLSVTGSIGKPIIGTGSALGNAGLNSVPPTLTPQVNNGSISQVLANEPPAANNANEDTGSFSDRLANAVSRLMRTIEDSMTSAYEAIQSYWLAFVGWLRARGVINQLPLAGTAPENVNEVSSIKS